MNPMMVAKNRTARLVAEMHKPTFSTSTPSPSSGKSKAVLAHIEDTACGPEFCHICGRATDHWGEHSDEQIVAWSNKQGILQDALRKNL